MDIIKVEEIDIKEEPDDFEYFYPSLPKPHEVKDYNLDKKESLYCIYCNVPVHHMNNYKKKKHYATHEIAKKSISCDQCPKKFSNYENFKIHLKMHNGTHYKCIECPKTFAKLKHYQNHLNIHSKNYVYCDICQKKFIWKDSLRQHIKTHFIKTKKFTHKCPHCEKTYDRERNMLLHSITHSDNKPFKCGKCGNLYYRKSSLERHKRNHSKKKLFFCKTCNVNFLRKYMYDSHSCGSIEMECDLCKIKFWDRGNLRSHMIHCHLSVKEPLYFCTICFKVFYIPSLAKRHNKHRNLDWKIIKIRLSLEERKRISKFNLFFYNDVKLMLNATVSLDYIN